MNTVTHLISSYMQHSLQSETNIF